MCGRRQYQYRRANVLELGVRAKSCLPSANCEVPTAEHEVRSGRIQCKGRQIKSQAKPPEEAANVMKANEAM